MAVALLAPGALLELRELQELGRLTVDIVIDPKDMLTVTVLGAYDLPYDRAVVTCAYVVATNPSGERAVAIELVTDPDTPDPTEPYACPLRRLKHEVLAPTRVLRVKAYR